jgi:hypothetical protein
MSCLPNTPIAYDERTSGWVQFTAPDLTGLAQYEPLSATVLTLPLIAEASEQVVLITQFMIREYATSGLTSNALAIHLWDVSGVTAPTLGVVYDPSTTNYVGQIAIATADFVRVSTTVREATVKPNLRYVTASDATSVNLYAVALFTGATPTTLHSSHAYYANVFTQLAQTTS